MNRAAHSPVVLAILLAVAACGEVAGNRPDAADLEPIDGAMPNDGATPIDATSTVTLTVTTDGTGIGTVTSAPAGIGCGGDCEAVFDAGTSVTLTATADVDATFIGWTGAGCTGTAPCTIVLDADTTVAATFTAPSFVVTVDRNGTGSGTVTSTTPAGIACGLDCSEPYPAGTSVTLAAAADAGSVFAGWTGGGCGGTADCAVSVAEATTVVATFNRGFTGDDIAASQIFTNAPLNNRPCCLAWDGASLWTGNAGSGSGNTEAQYNGAYAFANYYAAGIDFRAVFTKGDGTAVVYGRAISAATILRQTSPGVWTNEVTLTGGTIDSQANIHWDHVNREFITFNNGTLTRWSELGALLGTVTFTGYGTLNSEGTFPNNRGVVWAGGHYLTYSNGVLSAWNAAGSRVDTTNLTGAGIAFDSHFSLAYARGMVWIVDANSGSWRGYSVGL